MAIEFTNLVGDWRRIVEDYVTDPDNAADAPGVEGTITVSPVLGEGRHAPRGVPSGGVFYTFAPLDLRVYRGLLRDENMNSDITVATEVDGYPIAWRARFDLQYRRIKIPLQDVIFGPDEIVDGQISLSSLVARDGVPPEYEGSYVQLLDAVAQAAAARDAAEGSATDAATSASDAAGSATDADAARAAAVVARTGAETARSGAEDARDAADGHADRAEAAADSFGLTATATTGAPGSNATVTVTGDGPAYSLAFTVPRGDKGDKGDRGDDGEVSQAALDAAVASLVDNAPEALDTLSELADALGNDPNFATTVSTEIGKRALIDGAPAAYNTLGKLVTALQNHELGGSTDASLLTGALTSQVDISEATVVVNGDTALLYEGLELMIETLDVIAGYLDDKASVSHTHTVADIEATGTPSSSSFLSGTGSWVSLPSNTATGAQAQNPNTVTRLVWTPQRVHQAANAAISAREWTGTQAQYDALGSYDPNVTYYVEE